jgi:hypothetical protein
MIRLSGCTAKESSRDDFFDYRRPLTSVHFEIDDLFDFPAQLVPRPGVASWGRAARTLFLQFCLVFADVLVAASFVGVTVALVTCDRITYEGNESVLSALKCHRSKWQMGCHDGRKIFDASYLHNQLISYLACHDGNAGTRIGI